MAYEFPVIEFGLYEPDVWLMNDKYGMPMWWQKDMLFIFGCLRMADLSIITNQSLIAWIELGVNILPNPNAQYYHHSYANYLVYRDSYSTDKLDVLLHTFPFSKEFIQEFLQATTKMERPDLTVVIEQFIREQDYYEELPTDRFQL